MSVAKHLVPLVKTSLPHFTSGNQGLLVSFGAVFVSENTGKKQSTSEAAVQSGGRHSLSLDAASETQDARGSSVCFFHLLSFPVLCEKSAEGKGSETRGRKQELV